MSSGGIRLAAKAMQIPIMATKKNETRKLEISPIHPMHGGPSKNPKNPTEVTIESAALGEVDFDLPAAL